MTNFDEKILTQNQLKFVICELSNTHNISIYTYLTTVSEVEGIKSNGRIIRELMNSEVPMSTAKWSYRSFTN